MIKFDRDNLKQAQEFLAKSGISLAPEPVKDEAVTPAPPEKPAGITHTELWNSVPTAVDEPPAGTAAEAPEHPAVKLIINQFFSYTDSPAFDYLKKRELLASAHAQPNAAKYAEGVRYLIDTYGLDTVKKMAAAIHEGAKDTLQRLGVPLSAYGQSQSWAMWDMGKQEHYVMHPPETPDPNYERKSVFNYDDPNTKFFEVTDRHIGWETYNAWRAGAPCFRDATIWERIHPKNRAAIEELLAHPPKGRGEPGEGTLSSHELAKLGALLREPPPEAAEDKVSESEAREPDDTARLAALRNELQGVSKEDQEAEKERERAFAVGPVILVDAQVSRMVDGVEVTFERGKEYIVADDAASAEMEGARVVRITSFVELRPAPDEPPEVFASVVDIEKTGDAPIPTIPTSPVLEKVSDTIGRGTAWYVGLESLREPEQFKSELELNAEMEERYGLKIGDMVYAINYRLGGKVGTAPQEVLRFKKEEGKSLRVVLSPSVPGEPETEEFPWMLVQPQFVEQLEPRVFSLTLNDIFNRFDPRERTKILDDLSYHPIAATLMQLPTEQQEAMLAEVEPHNAERIREHIAKATEENDPDTDQYFREQFMSEVKAKILLGRFKLPEP